MKTAVRRAAIADINSCKIHRSFFPLMLVVLLVSISSCHDATKGQNSSSGNSGATSKKADSIKPKITVNVNKRYDNKGNLIGFDSTYSSYYSNVQGDTARMDSLFGNFNRYFNRGTPNFMNKEFNSLFFRDSLMYPDFFHNDFFLKRYELNDPYLRNMMRKMDSIKNDFYEQDSRRKQAPQKKK
jgi:hypothetical protein